MGCHTARYMLVDVHGMRLMVWVLAAHPGALTMQLVPPCPPALPQFCSPAMSIVACVLGLAVHVGMLIAYTRA